MTRTSIPSAGEGRPLITIGITCFREGEWLRATWDSVLAQTDPRWEAVLVMDGGADEATRAVFDALEHPRLRKFAFRDNVGPYPVRNKAFELTDTPYHFYLDGDDQLVPDSVRRALAIFETDPQAAFVYGDLECFGASNDVLPSPREVAAIDLAENQPTPGPCAYRVSTWTALGGFCEELARGNADYDFCIGAFEAGLKGRHCGAVFYRYRTGNAGKVSTSYNRRYHETHEVMVRRHKRFFADPAIRRRFLALGYRRAALANHAAGDAGPAARLAFAACRNGLWGDAELRRILALGVLPNWAFAGLRGLARMGRAA